jgi:hypothetical protein
MSLYVIGIGGTGAKCLESIAHLAAVGLSAPKINLLFIDADETNGSLSRARNSVSLYDRCHKLLDQNNQDSPWMSTQIFSSKPWSPFSRTTTDKNLSALFGYSLLKQNTPELGGLFDVLYTQSEREADLDVGFRGRPAIGSAVMSQVNLDSLDDDAWRQLIEGIKKDAGGGSPPKIILCGSMFGGTGASGLPTIGRLLHTKLQALGIQVPIACIFLLPYFNFTPSGEVAPGEVFARADQFLLNTEAALRYYLNQAEQFSTVYLLGNPSLSQVEFSIGKQTQCNKPHFIELYAGLAVRHFWLNESSNRETLVYLTSRQSKGRMTWTDLPDSNPVKKALSSATRFAYIWLSNMAPELMYAKQQGINRFQQDNPWFIKFFKPQVGLFGGFNSGGSELADFNDPKEQDAIGTISEWCLDYLRWLGELHQCDDESIDLFRPDRFIHLQGKETMSADELSQLVIGSEGDRSKQSQDTIPELKLELSRGDWMEFGKGTTGLAKALYSLCTP